VWKLYSLNSGGLRSGKAVLYPNNELDAEPAMPVRRYEMKRVLGIHSNPDICDLSVKLRNSRNGSHTQPHQEHGRGAYGPEEVCILVAAFDDARQRLEKSGVKLDEGRQTEMARERLAKSIIELAEFGERDPRQLADQALLGFARSNLRKAPRK
jgi:hypothetical protein